MDNFKVDMPKIIHVDFCMYIFIIPLVYVRISKHFNKLDSLVLINSNVQNNMSWTSFNRLSH